MLFIFNYIGTTELVPSFRKCLTDSAYVDFKGYDISGTKKMREPVKAVMYLISVNCVGT